MRGRSRAYAESARLCDYKRQYAVRDSIPASCGAGEREEARAIADWYAARRDLYNAASLRPWRDVPPEEAPEIDDGRDEPAAPEPRDTPRADLSSRLT